MMVEEDLLLPTILASGSIFNPVCPEIAKISYPFFIQISLLSFIIVKAKLRIQNGIG